MFPENSFKREQNTPVPVTSYNYKPIAQFQQPALAKATEEEPDPEGRNSHLPKIKEESA